MEPRDGPQGSDSTSGRIMCLGEPPTHTPWANHGSQSSLLLPEATLAPDRANDRAWPVSSRQKGCCAHLSLSLQPRASPLPRRGGVSGQPASPTVMLQASLQPYLQVRSLGQPATGPQRLNAHRSLAQRLELLVRTRAYRKEMCTSHSQFRSGGHHTDLLHCAQQVPVPPQAHSGLGHTQEPDRETPPLGKSYRVGRQEAFRCQ